VIAKKQAEKSQFSILFLHSFLMVFSALSDFSQEQNIAIWKLDESFQRQDTNLLPSRKSV